jgi:two-component system chemotaxis response regulator CheB
MAVKVLVVDDSILYRRVLTDALNSLPGVEVVGSVANGAYVVARVRDLRPDLVTLDIEMPGMNGIAVMEALRQAGLNVKVLVISSVTVSGGRLTLQALENGAFDFITKPAGSSLQENLCAIRDELSPRLRALAHRIEVQNILRPGAALEPRAEARLARPISRMQPQIPAGNVCQSRRSLTARKPEMVVIGVSTGGPRALATIFGALPGDLGIPILIVQHMPPIFTQLLAANLSAVSAMPVREASHGEAIVPNRAYLAPGGKQMRLIRDSSGKLLQLSDDPPENSCRPSVDYLFRSVANHFPGKALAVILTGMGDDGARGLSLLRDGGSPIIAQDEASCVVYGMPKAAVDAGLADEVVPLEAIAGRITALARRTQP